MKEYRIGGSGSRRDIIDTSEGRPGRLVGYIERIEVKDESATITKRSFSWRSRTVVRWRGRWPNGEPVYWQAGHRMICDAMKDWAQPERWTKWALPCPAAAPPVGSREETEAGAPQDGTDQKLTANS